MSLKRNKITHTIFNRSKIKHFKNKATIFIMLLSLTILMPTVMSRAAYYNKTTQITEKSRFQKSKSNNSNNNIINKDAEPLIVPIVEKKYDTNFNLSTSLYWELNFSVPSVTFDDHLPFFSITLRYEQDTTLNEESRIFNAVIVYFIQLNNEKRNIFHQYTISSKRGTEKITDFTEWNEYTIPLVDFNLNTKTDLIIGFEFVRYGIYPPTGITTLKKMAFNLMTIPMLSYEKRVLSHDSPYSFIPILPTFRTINFTTIEDTIFRSVIWTFPLNLYFGNITPHDSLYLSLNTTLTAKNLLNLFHSYFSQANIIIPLTNNAAITQKLPINSKNNDIIVFSKKLQIPTDALNFLSPPLNITDTKTNKTFTIYKLAHAQLMLSIEWKIPTTNTPQLEEGTDKNVTLLWQATGYKIENTDNSVNSLLEFMQLPQRIYKNPLPIYLLPIFHLIIIFSVPTYIFIRYKQLKKDVPAPIRQQEPLIEAIEDDFITTDN